MPLLDHFHPPLTDTRQWHSFHHAWCVQMAFHLNQSLPDSFRAEPLVQFGLEVDVGAFDVRVESHTPKTLREVATAPYFAVSSDQENHYPAFQIWQPPPPNQLIAFDLLTDSAEVLVYNRTVFPSLVGAVELVSESNKDRPAERQAFVSKCEAYLRQGVGLVIVDIVTSRRANLHQELLTRLGAPAATKQTGQLYTAAYRPFQQEQGREIKLAVWQETLAVGWDLPAMPLWLRAEFCARLDLNQTYVESCRGLRIPL
jgi:Protein of unknown function (DUF4058)